MSLISAKNLSFDIDGKAVLKGVSLDIQRGEIVTLVGPNGSGKSTLLRLLISVLKPRQGVVTRAPGLRIGYVPQKLAIDGTLPISVRRFLDMPVRVRTNLAMAALERPVSPTRCTSPSPIFRADSFSGCFWRARSCRNRIC